MRKSVLSESDTHRADGKPVIEDSVPIIYEASVENIELCDLRRTANVKKILDGFKQVLEVGINDLGNDYSWRKILRRVVEVIDAGKIGTGNLREVTWNVCSMFSDYIKSLGYEGLITFEGGEYGGKGDHDTYLIFNPENITIHQEQKIRFEQEPLPE